jgi:GrpB-like predicted nucleotidyltransferase (UPF0157 family)
MSDGSTEERKLSIAEPDLAWALAHAAEVHRVVTALADAGVPSLVLKGLPLAVRHGAPITSRGRPGDLDLLIAGDDLAIADAALLHAGYTAPDTRGRAVRSRIVRARGRRRDRIPIVPFAR